ncbi:MAG TPA: hypothetical protein VIZ22_10695 [Candidatus Limnocylindrales bacterium]
MIALLAAAITGATAEAIPATPRVVPQPVRPASTVATTAIVPGAVHRTSLAIDATYDVDVRLTVAARTLKGTVTIDARNDSGDGIDRLMLNTVMARLGALDLGAVTVDGSRVKARIDDQTIMVPLGGVLPDGASATIVVPFAARLRANLSGSNWLFTRANGIVDMHRWIPWISRKRPFNRPNHGDPFVTPVSDRVTVRLRTDVPLRFGTSGHVVSASSDGLTRTFRATNVRDFVVTAAADYRVLKRRVGDTKVRLIARPGFQAARALDAAANAVRKLEAKLGPYPYGTLRVVQSAGAYGMEGPGIAWIPTGTPSANLTYLVTHEIAHQWFYGLVGNDQAREPFADEAATDFVARRVLGLRRGSRCASDDLDRSIYRYSSLCYYEVVYIQGGNVLDNARQKMGSKPFWAALRGYVADHRWGLSHTRTLLDALDAATPLNLRPTWRHRFPSLY